MRQTVVTISLPVQPRSLGALKQYIGDMREGFEAPGGGAPDGYTHLAAAIPDLHFASIMVFEDEHYDPLLTVEMNFDGETRHFLPQLEVAALQPYIRSMIRCCKRPEDGSGPLYDAVTAEGSTLPLAPLLERCVTRPAVFHQGNRGLERRRILDEQALFDDVQQLLERPEVAAIPDAAGVHAMLRSNLVGAHAWLDTPAPPRWTGGERARDIAWLAGFVALAMLTLSAPGMIFALLVPWPVAVVTSLLFAALLVAATPGLIAALRSPPETVVRAPQLPPVPAMPLAQRAAIAGGLLLGLAAYLLGVALVFSLILAPLRGEAMALLYGGTLRVVAVGFVTMALPGAGILFWLRWLEDRDPGQDAPPLDPVKLRAIAAQEDKLAQNHMGSVVTIKPGMLRAILVRVGLWGLGLLLRVTATNGYLASMRTIHFAHWAILGNGGRLTFFSNFDGSWESYLDDFIEKAHVGLTLAWTNGIGFPKTRFLINEGATDGRLFKAWARHSMAEGLFWFSAYKDLSVNQIERQWRVAEGLRKKALSAGEATQWACDL